MRANPCRNFRRIVMLLAMLTFTGVGCQSGGQDQSEEAGVTVDLERSREQVRADLEEVEQLLQPAQFKLKNSQAEIPMTCELPSGEDGRSYLFDTRESASHVDDPEAKANLVANHWRDKGHAVEVATEAGYRVTAQTSQGGVLIFVASEPGMTFGGETPCVPA